MAFCKKLNLFRFRTRRFREDATVALFPISIRGISHHFKNDFSQKIIREIAIAEISVHKMTMTDTATLFELVFKICTEESSMIATTFYFHFSFFFNLLTGLKTTLRLSACQNLNWKTNVGRACPSIYRYNCFCKLAAVVFVL